MSRPSAAAAREPSCVFCRIVAGDAGAHVIHADAGTLAFLDTRPVFKGHTLLVPRAHVPTLPDLPPDALAPLMAVAQRIAAALVTGLGAQGSFVAVNNVVSQSVPHLHVHLVPRTKGDGLRGFFWPRTKYADDAEAADYARRLRAALDGDPAG
ncbi:HIT family protein [Georgenia sp. TF02-10]|uniref:HIT family protein n=1 Tax=Georgenia sp. TF02-10 TaxID=2917725 RepID=UPI002112026E|nr:HIT family protein [Georgenia sp. TF02-10]